MARCSRRCMTSDANAFRTHAAPTIVPPRSQRAAEVMRDFGLGAAIERQAHRPNDAAQPALMLATLALPGTITLVSGPSGSGKSSLLRALKADRSAPLTLIDLADVALPDCPLVDCFDGTSLDQTLLRLARVGLGDAWSYLRTPAELSDGQRWRLKLALALHRAGAETNSTMLIVDEFAALLDRITARLVARAFRRLVDSTGAHGQALSALVATSHDDLIDALDPERLVQCDFGRITTMARERRVSRSLLATAHPLAPSPPGRRPE